MMMMSRFFAIFVGLLSTNGNRNVAAETRWNPGWSRRSAHVRGNIHQEPLTAKTSGPSDIIEADSSRIASDSVNNMHRRRSTKWRRIEGRRLGIGGKDGQGHSSSSGSSGGSGGSSSSGSSGGSGVGWDENGSYCGCLCENWTYGSSGVNCEYTVHASNAADTGSSYVYDQGTQEVDEEGNENQANENDENQMNDYSYQQQSDIVAVVTTSDSDFDPFLAFDISQCDTYSNLWTNDRLACSNGPDGCQCIFTEQLIAQSRLSCSEAVDCPASCPICLQCLRQVCGSGVVVVSAIRNGRMVIPAAISLITIILATCFALSRRQKGGRGLEESLMDPSGTENSRKDTWMVPVCPRTGLPTEKSELCKPVWLAPVNFTPSERSSRKTFKTDSKRGREETVMLVVVPKPPPASVKNEFKTSDGPKQCTDVFPDLLKDPAKEGIVSQAHEEELPSIETDNDNPALEEFTPGLWVVPLSNDSIASSLSKSTENDDSSESTRSVITSQSIADDQNVISRDIAEGDDKEPLSMKNVTSDGGRSDIVTEDIVEKCPAETVSKVFSQSSSVTDSSTISSLDDDRSIGSMEGEI